MLYILEGKQELLNLFWTKQDIILSRAHSVSSDDVWDEMNESRGQTQDVLSIGREGEGVTPNVTLTSILSFRTVYLCLSSVR